MCFMLRIPCVSVRDLWFVSEQRKIIHIWTRIYIRSSVLLCMYMDRESGSNSEVDPIVKLIWSKVCITISITISITNLTTIVA